MNKQNILVSSVIGVIAVLASVFLGGTQVVKDTVHEVVKTGAISSPDLDSPYFSYGGVRRFGLRQQMHVATTTLCAIQAPAATSTLEFASFSITTGTSTAATIDIGTSTTAFATTTNLVAAVSIGSGATGQQFWSPVGGSVNDLTMAPSTYVVVKTAGAGLGGYTYGGTCQASFVQTVY